MKKKQKKRKQIKLHTKVVIGLWGSGLIIMIVLSAYLGFVDSGVDNAAHIGGLVCGGRLVRQDGSVTMP